MPEDQKFRPLPHLLSREEIRRAARLLADFGIEKIRITGGEPTTRPDLVDIVRDLAGIGFPGGIALSTNGVLFPRMAHDLLAAGLTKVNVSLDAAEAEHFRKMTRRDHFKPVVDSIALALSLPFDSVKINAVVIRGLNDDQILPLAAMTKDKKLGVRFIEFMPFGDNDWKESDWVGWEEVWDRLVAAGYVLSPIEKTLVAGPADEYSVTSPAGAHTGHDRLHHARLGPLLRHLQPHAAHAGRIPEGLPLRARGRGPPEADARGGERRGAARPRDARGRDQGRAPPHVRRHEQVDAAPACPQHERDRRLMAPCASPS